MITQGDRQERGYIRLASYVVKGIPHCPDDYCAPPPEPLRPFPDIEVGAVLVQGLGSTSDPTDQENFYMGGIATLLDELNIPYVVFSYNGHQDLNYRPWDTAVNLSSRSRELTHFVSAFPDGRVFLFAHSQGGNLASYWACNYANDEQLNKLAGTFILACPLLLPHPSAIEEDNQQKFRVSLDIIDGYAMELSELAEKLQRRFVVIRSWKDALAPIERSSTLLVKHNKAPLSEIVISDTDHQKICGHYITRTVIRTYITHLLS